MELSKEEQEDLEYFDYQIELAKKEIEKHKEDEFKGNGTLEDIAKMRYCNLIKIKILISKLQKENEKQDKVIDLMANLISCECEDDWIVELWYIADGNIEELVKQYFYGKVERRWEK